MVESHCAAKKNPGTSRLPGFFEPMFTVGKHQPRDLKFSLGKTEVQSQTPAATHLIGIISKDPKTMATNHQIHCINKSDRQNIHERIKSVGGVSSDGTRWKLTLDEAIQGIEAGKWRFYVSVNGKSVWVAVATAASGHKYLKTEADDAQTNNLLSLPECP
jgi:hypothetical protein